MGHCVGFTNNIYYLFYFNSVLGNKNNVLKLSICFIITSD